MITSFSLWDWACSFSSVFGQNWPVIFFFSLPSNAGNGYTIGWADKLSIFTLSYSDVIGTIFVDKAWRFWKIKIFRLFIWRKKVSLPVTFRYPVEEIIGSVFIWHIYPPWSIGFTFLMVNCHRFPSRWITEIRVFRVIIRSSIVKISFVLTLIHAI